MAMALSHDSVPRHMRIPGEEGYRTPTFEDAEFDLSTDSIGNSVYPPTPQVLRRIHTSALESVQGPSPRTGQESSRQRKKFQNDGSIGPAESRESEESSVLGLSWKQRIRHFTWAFFTLTMATGGIANVLYSGQFYIFLLPLGHTDIVSVISPV